MKVKRINMNNKDYKGIKDYMKKREEKFIKTKIKFINQTSKNQLIKGTIICLAKGCDNYLYKNQSPCDNRYCVDCF
jgi:hypothetical protein